MKEACVAERRKLAAARQRLHRPALPRGGVAVDEIEYFGLEHEKAAVDPASVAGRLLGEAADLVLFDVDDAESARRLHGGQGRVRLLLAMKFDQRGDVDVGQTVAIREAER